MLTGVQKTKRAVGIDRCKHTHPGEDGKEAERDGGSGCVGALRQRQLFRRGRLPLIGQKTEADKPQETCNTFEERKTGLLDAGSLHNYHIFPSSTFYRKKCLQSIWEPEKMNFVSFHVKERFCSLLFFWLDYEANCKRQKRKKIILYSCFFHSKNIFYSFDVLSFSALKASDNY